MCVRLCLLTFILASSIFIGCEPGAGDPASRNPSIYAPADPAKRVMDPMVLGKRTYNNCITCHQASGAGVKGKYPPLDGSEIAMGRPEIPTLILLHGLKGPLVIKGETYNEEMVPWGGTLTDEQIAAVLTYVRASWSNRATPVDPELVKRLRAQFTERRTSWTIEELNALKFE